MIDQLLLSPPITNVCQSNVLSPHMRRSLMPTDSIGMDSNLAKSVCVQMPKPTPLLASFGVRIPAKFFDEHYAIFKH